MESFWIDFAFSTLFTILKTSIKNEEKKAALKRAMLKLRNQINAAYALDPDFE